MFCIFDLDGTLLDTLEDIARAHNKALAARGLAPIETERYRFLVGKGLRNLSAQTLDLKDPEFASLTIEEQETKVIAHFEYFVQLYDKYLIDTTAPYNGIETMLRNLQNADVEMAVLSNKADHMTKKLIDFFFPSINFLFVEGMNKEWPRKPDPRFALELCQMHEKAAENVIFIGDTSTDMDTATNAGFRPIGVSWGFRSRDELFDHGAVEVFDTPLALGEYLLSQKKKYA